MTIDEILAGMEWSDVVLMGHGWNASGRKSMREDVLRHAESAGWVRRLFVSFVPGQIGHYVCELTPAGRALHEGAAELVVAARQQWA